MTLNKITYEIAATTIGIHALERRRNDGHSLLDKEGLVPIWMGEDIVTPRSYNDWDAAKSDLKTLQRNIEGLAPGERRTFLEGMVHSLLLAVRLFAGGSPTFDQKVTGLVGAPRGHEDADLIAASHDRINDLLTRMGVTGGSLRDRVRNWEIGCAIPDSDIPKVLTTLMAEAKRRTNEMIMDTADFEMSVNPVRDVPYLAKCIFDDRRMDLNMDILHSRASLKHLVCHNIFPGHATHTLYTHAEVTAGRSTCDALLVSANAITGCIQEGIADQGIHLIDWVENCEDELAEELRDLRAAAQTFATWSYMAEGQSAERTIKYLSEIGLGQDVWVRGCLRAAAHPFKGPFAASFWTGNETVRRMRKRVSESSRETFIRFLYGRAHSPQSLEMFQAS